MGGLLQENGNSTKEKKYEITLDMAKLLYARKFLYEGNFSCSLHSHTHIEIFYVTEGVGAFWFEKNSLNVKKGDLLVINSHISHTEISSSENPLGYIVLGVRGLEAFQLENENHILLRLGEKDEEILPVLENMVYESENKKENSLEVCNILLRAILLKLLRRIGFEAEHYGIVGEKRSKECALVKRYIDVHHKENLTLDDLAKHAHISKYYMVHSFKKEYGISPIRYLQFKRIAESKLLLEETEMSAAQIAQVLGFSSASQFSQCFKRLNTISPSEFRKIIAEKNKNKV